ncbi:DNA-processing protein DprA [Moraxella canis]|uniref:DNA-processing protein DprA n=1 Tax=Moraxella canis TaxID=90239 RepID=A0ABZ0X0R4_9GAMM|nr:DNA-processing protein DprA [Moraxella canis]WQE04910.1 DNA-processing protein DprA [Moraxella canis]
MSYSSLTPKQSKLALWYVTNTSLISYYKLVNHYGDAASALNQNQAAWQSLGIHAAHIKRWQDAKDVLAFLDKVHQDVALKIYGISYVGDEDYPDALKSIYDPPPVLFYRGHLARLKDRQIAIVGSRSPTEAAQKITFDLAQYLVQSGYTVTSGLAQGVDKQAHLGALSQLPALSGRTVGVMGTGIDVCYPRNHNALFAQIIEDGGCLVSELLPATPASKHTFPRRNRLVAGLSLATVVTEAALQSGSLITARLSAEQGKQVFAVPSHIHNPNAEGCLHLIREGATLIYHPDQILEDLSQQDQEFFNALPKSFSQGMSIFSEESSQLSTRSSQVSDTDTLTNPSPQAAINSLPPTAHTAFVPEHLADLYALIGEPCDLDQLVISSQKETGSLLAELMELEILGLIKQVGGRYGRV